MDGRLIETNSTYESMLGYSNEELRKTRFTVYTHPDDVEEHLALFRQVVAGERETFQTEKRYIRSDGHVL